MYTWVSSLGNIIIQFVLKKKNQKCIKNSTAHYQEIDPEKLWDQITISSAYQTHIYTYWCSFKKIYSYSLIKCFFSLILHLCPMNSHIYCRSFWSQTSKFWMLQSGSPYYKNFWLRHVLFPPIQVTEQVLKINDQTISVKTAKLKFGSQSTTFPYIFVTKFRLIK